MSVPGKRLRCAIYTRKSSEEGLEQEFNSLDAQREACSAFIASQTGLGWKLFPEQYNDGGISGGSMERPALQRLLADIEAGRIDVVVVYKIDRLTRALMDFARIVEIFDRQGVSFVSVTQQFNTTTSMGRLTLNVLLSFAQFEREVTAERIRDKIAASKKKGMWMGGVVPLGYQVKDRKLLIEQDEAKIVRHLFDRYLELGSVPQLVDEAHAITLPANGRRGGKPFGRGNLYHLLANPIYVGKIRHKQELHEGEHQAIIDPDRFERVQALLAAQKQARSSPANQPDAHRLTGLLFDDSGDRLSPSHATKRGKRYRYYISSRLMREPKQSDGGWRVPAREIEALVEATFKRMLADQASLVRWLQEAGLEDRISACLGHAREITGENDASLTSLMHQSLMRLTLHRDRIELQLDRAALLQLLINGGQQSRSVPKPLVLNPKTITLKRRGAETRLVVTAGSIPQRDPDAGLINLLARAHAFLATLIAVPGRNLTDVAALHRTDLASVSRILPYAFLAPALIEAILAGRQSPSLTAQRLLRMTELPILWADQIAALQ